MAGYDGYDEQPQGYGDSGTNPNRDKIVQAYREALGRDPESEAVIQGHLNNPGGVQGALGAIWSSPEAAARRSAPTTTTQSTATQTQPAQPMAEGPGLPAPERFQFSSPTAPTPYSSTYSPAFLQSFSGVGEADRNRLMQAILQSPETMGQTQQDQLFEQQKELLNAQRQQQQAQLGQNLAQRGLSGLGGAALAGQAAIGQDFSGQLLGAQRDIAIKAAQQNRADQLAAIQMQDAMAQGDYQRMAQIYQANQQERANAENFLRQAAELTQQGQLTINQQQLAAEAAQQQEIMDFYTFLENQRKALTDANLLATQIALGGR